ncbi:MAG: hypothetical protein IKK52_03215 [Alphaproteobacteria bacterium]|nr:hypothetical protein [Alphaproteobacteria bacterium]
MLEKETQHTTIKDFSNSSYSDKFDDDNFRIRPLKKMRLIDTIDELDDECEFEKNMFNFGEYEDLPASDRALDKRCRPN